MKFFGPGPPEGILLYADTVVREVRSLDGDVLVRGEDFADTEFSLRFKDARMIQTDELPGLGEQGQVLKLKNGSKRLLVFDDEGGIVFEVEYRSCEEG